MMISRINGWEPAVRLRNELDRVMGDVFQTLPEVARATGLAATAFPALNLWEDERNLFVEAELPGLKLEDLEIFVQGEELTIKGERKCCVQEGKSFHRRERPTGEFRRTVALPMRVDPEKVEARLQQGVLTISLPKAQEVLPRKIEVKGK